MKNEENSHRYIFRILQHFATKLCNFTNFKLFLVVVVDFVLLARLKFNLKLESSIKISLVWVPLVLTLNRQGRMFIVGSL